MRIAYGIDQLEEVCIKVFSPRWKFKATKKRDKEERESEKSQNPRHHRTPIYQKTHDTWRLSHASGKVWGERERENKIIYIILQLPL